MEKASKDILTDKLLQFGFENSWRRLCETPLGKSRELIQPPPSFQIDNPAYKGPWVHPEIDNAEYSPDASLYKRSEICALGFDLWQVKSGTIFDNILFTDDIEVAKERGEALKKTLEGEKKMKSEQVRSHCY